MSKKSLIAKTVICSVSGVGCLFAGFMMSAVAGSYARQLIKKGEK